MHLVLPSPIYEESYVAYISELGHEDRHPFPLDFDHSDFSKLLKKLDNFRFDTGLPEGFVPATTYWLVENNELIGVSNLRHCLNERLRHNGGHIGLGIRPSYRAKGLGKLLLRLTIEKAFERGIREVHVHCDKANERSARTICANGGKLESEINDEGTILQRYVVYAL